MKQRPLPLVVHTGEILHRPIYGAAFGDGVLSLASVPCVQAGLHAVRYLVIDPRAGTVISSGPSKIEVLDAARRALGWAGGAANDDRWQQGALFSADEAPMPEADAGPPRRVSRRRREVFERSGGRCFYCRAPVQLHDFEVEHQIPKALDGDDGGLNLVAACRACNRTKADRTALEFVTQGPDR